MKLKEADQLHRQQMDQKRLDAELKRAETEDRKFELLVSLVKGKNN